MRRILTALLCLSLVAALPAQAADPATPAAAATPQMTAQQFLSTLTFREGKIKLPGDIATLDLPASFRYLDPADADKLLTEGWGNPPGSKSLGMIVPADVN